MLRSILAIILAGALVMPLGAAVATQDYAVIIKNHRFEPAEITVPAGQKIKLVVDNQDATPEEFESHAMNREKVIPGRSKANIWIGPLKPGSYDFVGEYHEDTARGKVIAK